MSRFRFRKEHAPLAALVALAAALRIPGLGYGLPFPLLNPDEASIVPRAWRIVHGGGPDPGWYDYPTLLFYVLAPFQALVDEPSYGVARGVAAAIGILGVSAAWWLGRSAYGALAGIVAGATVAVATVHVAYSHMAVTDGLLTLLVTVSLALLIQGRLEWAGLVAGLAASAKYPGVFLAAPLLVLGWRDWRRLALAVLLAVASFALTSPFVLLNAGEARDDIDRVQRLARAGWLGFEDDHATPLAFLDRLWESLGPAVGVGLFGLVLAVRKLVRNEHKVARSRADLALVVFGLVYFVDLLTLGAHFDRYVLPLIPVLGALAGRSRSLGSLALVLLVVPLVWSIQDVRVLGKTDTRLVAQTWIDAHVPRSAAVAVDPSLAPVRAARVVRLRLPGPGRPEDRNRSVDRLRALGVDYVVLTGAVGDRVQRASAQYPVAARLYATIGRQAARVFEVEPGGELAGPWVTVYRL